ncbi:hypothetical protein CORC01_12199 [Colletotrichum orchidophilum]|uniref:Uncharacterized protein n=1 Tax=Colletotrichum orchidophilum TaxID=1209926 RepID=A0A1G4ATQ0_9PEZI|nr:uncharacterized protein CORC01_12199 [Colletotrichum orchidophilum]OHE92481.1 hypothetical protein CORC01_12199 [Colletotrichum orchidophilum]
MYSVSSAAGPARAVSKFIAELLVTFGGSGLELGWLDGLVEARHEEGLEVEELLLALDGPWVGGELLGEDFLEDDVGGGPKGFDFGHGVAGAGGLLAVNWMVSNEMEGLSVS